MSNISYMLTEDSFNIDELEKNETLFHLANGYIGVRGNFEEEYNLPSIRGTYINGFYDIGDLKYTEKFIGFSTEYQKLVNITDVQSMELWIDGERFSLLEGEIISYKRTLDMKQGVTLRQIHWKSNKGHEVIIEIKRMASFSVLELFTISYSIKSINFEGEIRIISKQDSDVSNFSDSNDPRLAHESVKNIIHEEIIIEQTSPKNIYSYLCAKTSRSNLKIVSAVTHKIPLKSNIEVQKYAYSVNTTISSKIEKEETLQFVKQAVFTDSIRYKDCLAEAKTILKTVDMLSAEYWFKQQELYLKGFWEDSDVEIVGEDNLNLSIRYSLYCLLQSIGKDKFSNISAKGLSGEGYEGHYFWDTEIYIFPFFLITNPKIALNILSFRYRTLDKARENAKLLGHTQGAIFPWRTISGTECSSYFPSGSAQYHINGDIAYTFISYYLATNDIEMVKNMGAEVLFEIARLWLDVGHFYKDYFMIDCVTGPDEYTCLVNNNYYTNACAKYSLEWACKFYELICEDERLIQRLNINETEVMEWKSASEKLFLPVDSELNINPQDDSFLKKKPWDLENTPQDKFPLLLNYHPMYIYRYQVLKQADTVLSHFLFEDYQSKEVMKRSFEYYEKITTHDSSLSTCIYSIMASRLGFRDKAYNYFIQTAMLDLEDKHNNTKYGIHTACMGGTYISVIYGFLGFRIKEDGIYFSPSLPDKWEKVKFSIMYKGVRINCEVGKDIIILSKDYSKKVKVFVSETNGDDWNEYDFVDCLEVVI